METLEALKVTVILILALIVTYYSTQLTPRRKKMTKNEKFKKDMKALFSIIIGTLAFFIIVQYFADKSIQTENEAKLAHFQKGKELICGVGRFAKSDEGYIVSKEHGYTLSKEKHFQKSDLLISLSSCEIR